LKVHNCKANRGRDHDLQKNFPIDTHHYSPPDSNARGKYIR
jgi:hypothetical protein